MREKVINIINDAINVINKNRKKHLHLTEYHPSYEKQKIETRNDTVLYGKGGKLDSLELVNLIVTIEQNFEDEFDVSITIADERAMSQQKSPFRKIESLADYIEVLVKEKLDDR